MRHVGKLQCTCNRMYVLIFVLSEPNVLYTNLTSFHYVSMTVIASPDYTAVQFVIMESPDSSAD